MIRKEVAVLKARKTAENQKKDDRFRDISIGDSPCQGNRRPFPSFYQNRRIQMPNEMIERAYRVMLCVAIAFITHCNAQAQCSRRSSAGPASLASNAATPLNRFRPSSGFSSPMAYQQQLMLRRQQSMASVQPLHAFAVESTRLQREALLASRRDRAERKRQARADRTAERLRQRAFETLSSDPAETRFVSASFAARPVRPSP